MNINEQQLLTDIYSHKTIVPEVYLLKLLQNKIIQYAAPHDIKFAHKPLPQELLIKGEAFLRKENPTLVEITHYGHNHAGFPCLYYIDKQERLGMPSDLLHTHRLTNMCGGWYVESL